MGNTGKDASSAHTVFINVICNLLHTYNIYNDLRNYYRFVTDWPWANGYVYFLSLYNLMSPTATNTTTRLSISPLCENTAWYTTYKRQNDSSYDAAVHGDILRCVTGLLWGNPPVTGGFPTQRTSNANVWCFLRFKPEKAFKQIVKLSVIWGAMTLGRLSLKCVTRILRPCITLTWNSSLFSLGLKYKP